MSKDMWFDEISKEVKEFQNKKTMVTGDFGDSLTNDMINTSKKKITIKSPNNNHQNNQSPKKPKSPKYNNNILFDIVNNIRLKILVLCNENELTTTQIGEKLNITRQQVSSYIRRKRGEDVEGLLIDGFIEIKGKENKSELYKTTQLGILRLIEFEKDYDKEQERIKQQEEIKQQEAFEYEQRCKLTEQKIEYIKDFITLYYKNKKEQTELIRIDFRKVCKYDPSLADEILEDFEETKKKFEIAFESFNPNFKNIISFYNFPTKTEKISISALNHNYFDKFVLVEGLLRSRSECKSQIKRTVFECSNCGKIKIILQQERHIKSPKGKCSDCEDKKWFMKRNYMITVQKIEIEQFTEELKGVTEPRCVNILLINDLCKDDIQKYFNPGTRIKFWGILKPEYNYINFSKKTILDHYLEANGFEVLEQSLEFNVTEKQQQEIKKLSKRKDIIKLLTDSFAPEIYGNKPCKQALLLSAVKGYKQLPKYKRDRIHVMFVGNPGSGKTVMVKKLIELTELSRFASGLNSSRVGLMAAVVQDKFIGGFKLSAGAVPLANNGICAIDEFDKIPDEDKKSMNSAMEEGEIIVDKASIHQKLLANTTIVSTCNPYGERFVDEQQYYKQYNLPRSLIDRFDLIFVVNADAFTNKNKYMEVIEDNKNEYIEEDLLSKYLIMAQNHEIKVSKDIEIYLAQRSDEFEKKWIENNFIFGFRQFNSVRNITYAISRLKLIKEVTKKEVDEAFELYEISVISQQYNIK